MAGRAPRRLASAEHPAGRSAAGRPPRHGPGPLGPRRAPNDQLQSALLGPISGAGEPPEELSRSTTPGGRVVLLIDQSKAFERLSPAWVRAVLEWQQTPSRLVDLIMAFTIARHATFALPSGKRVCRP
eukprot:537957-Alexandrium_andersonii.AAC.1